jgi:hypothetical protein
MGEAACRTAAENSGVRPVGRESFRLWWSSYRRELKMSTEARNFAAAWWRDLPPSMKMFLTAEGGVKEQEKALRGDFAGLSENDQERLMCAARDMLRDLKPVTWMG